MSESQDIEFQLSQWLDGQLPPEQAEPLRRRLDQDPALAAELARYESLNRLLAARAETMPDVDWQFQRDSVAAALEREALLRTPHRRILPGPLRWAVGIAAVAAGLALAVALWPHVTGPEGSGQQLAVEIIRPEAVRESGGVEGSLLRPAMAGGAEPSILQAHLVSQEVAALDLASTPALRSFIGDATVIAAAPRVQRGGGFGLDEL